jgi:DnaJ-class molecular chaperone
MATQRNEEMCGYCWGMGEWQGSGCPVCGGKGKIDAPRPSSVKWALGAFGVGVALWAALWVIFS